MHSLVRPGRSRLWLLWVLALAHWTGACSKSETRPATQLMLVADTDMPELNEVHFEIRAPGGELQSARGAIAPGAPAYVSLVKSAGAADGPYHVELHGSAAGAVLVTRAAELSFVPGQTRTILLHLVRACAVPSCAEGLVCAHDQCRALAMTPGELLPWSGSPPLLQPASLVDAGTGAGGGDEDAGTSDGGLGDAGLGDAGLGDASLGDAGGGDSGPSDASVDGQAGCQTDVPRCQGGRLEICANGVVTGTMACPSSTDPCTQNSCVDGMGCVPVPRNEGTACGSGLTCAQGVCGGGQACTGMCNVSCNRGVQSCDLACSSTGLDCTLRCPAGSDCHVDCKNANICSTTCSGECAVDCASTGNCEIVCQKDASCDVTCSNAANCDKLRCMKGASCVLRCGTYPTCRFGACDGASIVNCGGGVYTCNAPCP